MHTDTLGTTIHSQRDVQLTLAGNCRECFARRGDRLTDIRYEVPGLEASGVHSIHSYESLGLVDGKFTKEKGVRNTENQNIRADPSSKYQHRGYGEHRAASQNAKAVSKMGRTRHALKPV